MRSCAILRCSRCADCLPGNGRGDLAHLAQLLAERRIRTVIERSFTLDDIVTAIRYLDTGRKTGNVLLMFAQPDGTSPAEAQ